MRVLDIIILILLPPLAVLLRHGLGGKFVINLILFLLGYIPGLIHGIYVMYNESKEASE